MDGKIQHLLISIYKFQNFPPVIDLNHQPYDSSFITIPTKFRGLSEAFISA